MRPALPRATCVKASARPCAAVCAPPKPSCTVPYDLADVTGASMGGGWISRMIDWGFTRGIGRPTAGPRRHLTTGQPRMPAPGSVRLCGLSTW
jgi:hypothetical protein